MRRYIPPVEIVVTLEDYGQITVPKGLGIDGLPETLQIPAHNPVPVVSLAEAMESMESMVEIDWMTFYRVGSRPYYRQGWREWRHGTWAE